MISWSFTFSAVTPFVAPQNSVTEIKQGCLLESVFETDTYKKRQEGSKIKGRNSSWDAVLIKASADPLEALKLRWHCRVGPPWDKGVWPLCAPFAPIRAITGCSIQGRGCDLGRTKSFEPRQLAQGATHWGLGLQHCWQLGERLHSWGRSEPHDSAQLSRGPASCWGGDY